MSKGNPIYRFRLRGGLLRAFTDELERNNANPLVQHLTDSEAIRLAIAEWINHKRRSRKQGNLDFDIDIYTGS